MVSIFRHGILFCCPSTDCSDGIWVTVDGSMSLYFCQIKQARVPIHYGRGVHTSIFIISTCPAWNFPVGFQGQNRPTRSLGVIGGGQWLSRLPPWCFHHSPVFFRTLSLSSCSLSLQGAYCPLYALTSSGGTLVPF